MNIHEMEYSVESSGLRRIERSLVDGSSGRSIVAGEWLRCVALLEPRAAGRYRPARL